MPKIPQETKDVKDLQGADILNGVRNAIGGEYADMVPQAVKPGDTMLNGNKATNADSLNGLREIGNVIINNPLLQNQFLNMLCNRIATVIISSRLYRNPWARFKKGTLELGEVIEEIFVSMADPMWYLPDNDRSPFKTAKPAVDSAFHVMNYQIFYETTVNYKQLKTAFLSWQGLNDLVSRIIEQIYTAANYDEFLVMKYMIAKLILAGKIATVTVDALDKSSARDITVEMVTQANDLQFMSNRWNEAGVTTYTDPNYLWTILTNKARAIFDVEVLAVSFNMDKADLIGRQISVDSFTIWDSKRLTKIFENSPWTPYQPFTADEIAKLATVTAIMLDEKWFMIFDNMITMADEFNPVTLDYNYFYHNWKTFSASPFANAIAFTNTVSTITGVTVTAPVTSAVKGSMIQMTATVAGTGFINQGVSWSVNGTDSTISLNGILQIGKNETAKTLTVTATSRADDAITGTYSITL